MIEDYFESLSQMLINKTSKEGGEIHMIDSKTNK